LGVAALVLTVTVRVDHLPLSSIGLRRPDWSTLAWAAAILGGVNYVLSPALMSVVTRLGLGGFERGFAAVERFPLWYRVFLGVSAGVVEEILYRGYAIERFASMTGSRVAGAAIATALFAAAHLPSWGAGPALVFAADATVAAAFYLWRHDLVALILAHGAGDAIALVLLPTASVR
jgi:membrane protease YdiL (CAAX protease family)